MQTHISGKKVLRQKHATLTPSMYSAYKLHTVGSKAFQNKDIRSRGHFLFTNLYHGFASYFRGFCLITKAPPPPPRWFFTNSVPFRVQVRRLAGVNGPVHACPGHQRPAGKPRQFAMAGGPSGRREAKKVLKTSHAVLIKEGLVCWPSTTFLSGGRRLGFSISASGPS